jgi:hypothetical protein
MWVIHIVNQWFRYRIEFDDSFEVDVIQESFQVAEIQSIQTALNVPSQILKND